MDFRHSEEHEAIQQMVRDLARDEFAPKAAQIDEESRFPAENLKKLGELGLMGMLFPEEYGGSGVGAVAYAIAMREVSGGCASTGVEMGVTNMVGEAIFKYGTEAQRRKYLPILASGDKLGAFALTEPSAGSDAGSLRTTAVKDGDSYVINGSKAFITNATYSAVTIVMTLTQKEPKKITAFLVEPGTPGFIVGKPEKKMGLKGSDTVPLTFEDCRVPASAMLGEEGQGLKIALAALDGGRVGIGSQALGIAKASLEFATNYAKERKQFGHAIGEFQAIQWMLADSAMELDAAQLLIYRAAVLKDQGKPNSREAAMAKMFATEAGNRVCHKCVQILGGYGYVHEYPVERHLRDIRVTMIYEGTSEIQRVVVARSLLKD